jgi:SAM-dependent methyltransferase
LKQEIQGEKKYGIDTTGADELRKLKAKGVDISHSTIYMPVSYQVIETALAHLPAANKNHFLDIGCGKGRALSVAAFYGFKKITGIDLSKKFCEDALQNLELIKQKVPVLNYEVITADAAAFSIPDDVDCIFLFNPFDNTIMEKVLDNINVSRRQKPRTINIIYANPIYKYLFLRSNFFETLKYQY